jgi:hypothetical protein
MKKGREEEREHECMIMLGKQFGMPGKGSERVNEIMWDRSTEIESECLDMQGLRLLYAGWGVKGERVEIKGD